MRWMDIPQLEEGAHMRTTTVAVTAILALMTLGALAQAEELVKSSITPEDQDKLVDDYLDKVVA